MPRVAKNMSYELNAVETRILGCLLEKERITPENYPLSLHGLTAACNQSTNREPVVSYDERTVEAGLTALRERKLATAISGAGLRVQKYRHRLLEHFNLDEGETALICVLLLRGPQTPGELRARTERMHGFSNLDAVAACLEELEKGEAPLVRLLPPRPGQKEKRYIQLLSAESLVGESAEPDLEPPSKVEILENEVAALREEVRQLRDEFAAFRKQFE
jgi:uncharacterized protein YceH (UPF0502 family)